MLVDRDLETGVMKEINAKRGRCAGVVRRRRDMPLRVMYRSVGPVR